MRWSGIEAARSVPGSFSRPVGHFTILGAMPDAPLERLTRRSAADSASPLREGEALFRLLVSSLHDYAVFALDAAGYVLTWNPGAQRFKGYEAHEIIGRHFSTFYPPEDIAAGKPDWELEVAAREGRFED